MQFPCRPCTSYRLVAADARGRRVFTTADVASYRRALSLVAAAARQAASIGPCAELVLQGRCDAADALGPADSADSRAPLADDSAAETGWTCVDRWDTRDIARIVSQSAAPAGASLPVSAAPELESPPTAATPEETPIAKSCVPATSTRPRTGRVRPRKAAHAPVRADADSADTLHRPLPSGHRGTRLPLVATAVVLAFTWVTLLLLQTDGQLMAILAGAVTPRASATTAEEIPFAAQPAADVAPPAGSVAKTPGGRDVTSGAAAQVGGTRTATPAIVP